MDFPFCEVNYTREMRLCFTQVILSTVSFFNSNIIDFCFFVTNQLEIGGFSDGIQEYKHHEKKKAEEAQGGGGGGVFGL